MLKPCTALAHLSALAWCGASGAAHAQAADAGNSTGDIVVTALKQEERLATIPLAVSVVQAANIAAKSQYRLQDYYQSVPGLSFTSNQLGGAATIAIRGIASSDFAAPTVGITVDDMPFGSSTLLGGGFLVPDLDPSDLERIEVLRGPQGTLYGASSIGGLLKYVTHDPSTQKLEGHVSAGSSGVDGGGSAGYNVSGSLNVPVSDDVAVRASGFARRDPGFIDNLGYTSDTPIKRDVNSTRTWGGHLSALWKPSDDFRIKLGGFAQYTRNDGSPYVEIQPGVGDLQQRFLPGSGYTNRDFQALSLNMVKSFGDIEVTSVTGLSRTKLRDSYDLTQPVGPLTTTAFPTAPGYTENLDSTVTTKFTQEVRATIPIGTKIDWLVGGFYTREKTRWTQFWNATDENRAPLGTLVQFKFGSTFQEAAAFTNLTYRFDDRFDIQGGIRKSFIRTTFYETDTGPYVSLFEAGTPDAPGPNVLVFPDQKLKEQAFTYAVSPRFKLSSDFMIYARFSSGYRPGGVNSTGSLVGTNPFYKHDDTTNYEVGVKTTVLNGGLFLDASVYRIDWNKVQIQVNNNAGLSFFSNGGKARSQGVELAYTAKPFKGLKLSGWVAFNDAKLVEDFPANDLVIGSKGDRLPFSSRFSSNTALDYSFPVGPHEASVGVSYSHVGRRLGNFLAPGAFRQDFRAYDKVDLTAGLELDSFKLTAFVNNVTNKRGILGGGRGSLISQTGFTIIQPRTIGFAIAKDF